MIKGASLLILAAFAGSPVARAEEPIMLKLGFPTPPVSLFNSDALAPWAQQIEADTKGAVKIQIFPGPSFTTFANVLDRVLNGVADIGFLNDGARVLAAFKEELEKVRKEK